MIFNVKYLAKMVREGQLRDASYYLGGFAGYDSSYEGGLLNVFLFDLLAYKAFADGRIRVIGYLCDWLVSIYKKPVLDKYPCFATRCPLPAQRSCQVRSLLITLLMCCDCD